MAYKAVSSADRHSPVWSWNQAFITGLLAKDGDVETNVNLAVDLIERGGFGRVLLHHAQWARYRTGPEIIRRLREKFGRNIFIQLHCLPQSISPEEMSLVASGNHPFIRYQDILRDSMGRPVFIEDHYKLIHNTAAAEEVVENIAIAVDNLDADSAYVDGVNASASWQGLESSNARMDCIRAWVVGVFNELHERGKGVGIESCADTDPEVLKVSGIIGQRDWQRGRLLSAIQACDGQIKYILDHPALYGEVPRQIGWCSHGAAEWLDAGPSDVEYYCQRSEYHKWPISMHISLPYWHSRTEEAKALMLDRLRKNALSRRNSPLWIHDVSCDDYEMRIAELEDLLIRKDQQISTLDKLNQRYMLAIQEINNTIQRLGKSETDSGSDR